MTRCFRCNANLDIVSVWLIPGKEHKTIQVCEQCYCRLMGAPAPRGPLCPACNSGDHGVGDSRPFGNTVRRRRDCKCGHRYYTVEVQETEVREKFRAQIPEEGPLTHAQLDELHRPGRAL